MLYAVIMAGGAGTRLWPLSRKGRPKQALRLIGDRTMFQLSIDRLLSLFSEECIYVVTSSPLAEALRPQAPGLPHDNFILEPSGRDSAPAAGLAAVWLLKYDPDAIMVMLTADHYIADARQFRAALVAAAQAAAEGTIVTLGVQPTYPATGFGYIRASETYTTINGFRVYGSEGFTEKPDRPTAIRFIEEGRYTWNSGMFIWRADRLMAEYAAQLPDLYETLLRISAALGRREQERVLSEEWSSVRRVSVDYGIMEHADRVVVIPVEFGWSDIGSWAALLDVLEVDDKGNAIVGAATALDTRNCLIRSEGRLVATIGLEEMIIVDTPDVLLVCPKNRAEAVRDVVRHLEALGANHYL